MGEPTTNKSSLSNVNTNDGNDGDGDGNGMNALSSMGIGEEEIWVHRIFYIVAKVANFRANIPKFQEPSPHDEQVRLQSRFTEWNRLKGLCDSWNNNCPRPMRPYGYLLPSSNNQSAFPNVWYVRAWPPFLLLAEETKHCRVHFLGRYRTPDLHKQIGS